MRRVREIAQRHDLKIIEDVRRRLNEAEGEQAGLLGDIGIFSLNYHKHIHAGEGGIIITNDDNLVRSVPDQEPCRGCWG